MRARRIHLNLNPENPDDARVLEYLVNADASYSKSAVKAIVWYLDRHEPAPGSKAFLQQVITTIQDSLKEVTIAEHRSLIANEGENNSDISVLDFLDAMG